MNITQKNIIQYGDFQTPLVLAEEVLDAVFPHIFGVQTVIEPTCGTGTFLQALLKSQYARDVKHVLGLEINPQYVTLAREKMAFFETEFQQIEIIEQDFFKIDWENLMKKLPKPVLFIGNPPWVTNSQLGKVEGANVPTKTNFKRAAGLDAMTGCGNFDISEWMLINLLHLIENTDSALAFLVKTSVARKVFEFANSKGVVANMQIRNINAKKHFGVNVDAALFFTCNVKSTCFPSIKDNGECAVYESLQATEPTRSIGVINGKMVSDIIRYKKRQSLDALSPFKWRSGLKHDCSKVMEIVRLPNGFLNGLGELVFITDEYVYPFLKSSDIASGVALSDKWVIVPQKYIGEATAMIAENSPSTWQYLNKYATIFENRKSSIYRNAPPFAIFGIGDYSFKPWKVAVSGLYKNINFCLISPYKGKPVMLDDTCYFLGFDTKDEAVLVHELLMSEPVLEFLDSIVFRDDKRPVTAKLLNRIDLKMVAKLCKRQHQFDKILQQNVGKQMCFDLSLA